MHARVPLRLLTTGGSAFIQVFVDFGILMRVLLLSALRRRVVRGAFRSHELAETGDDAASVGARVWRTLLADYSPNAYVVEMEPERGLVLLHDLVPNRSSEEPA